MKDAMNASAAIARIRHVQDVTAKFVVRYVMRVALLHAISHWCVDSISASLPALQSILATTVQ